MSSRSVQYTSSPLLASKTPIWRSQFIVAVIAAAFLGLVARAAYVQVIDNAFFKRQGAVRFVRTLDLPANRGRILTVMATSWPLAYPCLAFGPTQKTSSATQQSSKPWRSCWE